MKHDEAFMLTLRTLSRCSLGSRNEIHPSSEGFHRASNLHWLVRLMAVLTVICSLMMAVEAQLSEMNYRFSIGMKSMIVGQDCTNMGARYQCLSTDLAINTLNTDLRNKGIEGRDYTTIININFEFIPNPQVTCKSKSFLKSSNIFYRIRFTSYTSNRVSVLCNYMDFNSIFADSQNIISFEIDNLAMTSCRIDHSYSFNMKITNSVIYSTLISLGFDLQGKIIQTDMQYYLNIEGSKFEQGKTYHCFD